MDRFKGKLIGNNMFFFFLQLNVPFIQFWEDVLRQRTCHRDTKEVSTEAPIERGIFKQWKASAMHEQSRTSLTKKTHKKAGMRDAYQSNLRGSRRINLHRSNGQIILGQTQRIAFSN